MDPYPPLEYGDDLSDFKPFKDAMAKFAATNEQIKDKMHG